MKRKRAFRITLTDESNLEQKASWLASPLRFVTVGIAILLAAIGIGIAVGLLTPLRRLSSGYLPNEQRIATETAYMRIDSMREALRVEREYLNNILTLLNTGREPVAMPDTSGMQISRNDNIETDSLLLPSEQEVRFTMAIQRREGFSSSVLAPLAAQGMVFLFPASSGIYEDQNPESKTQRVIVSRNACIRSVADGSVVGVSRSTREHGYIIWIQHDNGFLSRYSRLGMPIVDQGTQVEAGEAIALPASGVGTKGDRIDIQLWHDGEQLSPRRYIPAP